MADFIPQRDDALDVWFQAYQLYAVANAAALGLTPATSKTPKPERRVRLPLPQPRIRSAG